MATRRGGDRKKNKTAHPPHPPHPPDPESPPAGQTPTTAHAFRMTLVAQGKLPQIKCGQTKKHIIAGREWANIVLRASQSAPERPQSAWQNVPQASPERAEK